MGRVDGMSQAWYPEVKNALSNCHRASLLRNTEEIIVEFPSHLAQLILRNDKPGNSPII